MLMRCMVIRASLVPLLTGEALDWALLQATRSAVEVTTLDNPTMSPTEGLADRVW